MGHTAPAGPGVQGPWHSPPTLLVSRPHSAPPPITSSICTAPFSLLLGCCLTHASLNKASKIFNIYSVGCRLLTAQVFEGRWECEFCVLFFKHSRILNRSESQLQWQRGPVSCAESQGALQWSAGVGEKGHCFPPQRWPEFPLHTAAGKSGTHKTWGSLLSDGSTGRETSTLLGSVMEGWALELTKVRRVREEIGDSQNNIPRWVGFRAYIPPSWGREKGEGHFWANKQSFVKINGPLRGQTGGVTCLLSQVLLWVFFSSYEYEPLSHIGSKVNHHHPSTPPTEPSLMKGRGAERVNAGETPAVVIYPLDTPHWHFSSIRALPRAGLLSHYPFHLHSPPLSLMLPEMLFLAYKAAGSTVSSPHAPTQIQAHVWQQQNPSAPATEPRWHLHNQQQQRLSKAPFKGGSYFHIHFPFHHSTRFQCPGGPGRYCRLASRHHNEANIAIKQVTRIVLISQCMTMCNSIMSKRNRVHTLI